MLKTASNKSTSEQLEASNGKLNSNSYKQQLGQTVSSTRRPPEIIGRSFCFRAFRVDQ
jgi:hypothetical protein